MIGNDESSFNHEDSGSSQVQSILRLFFSHGVEHLSVTTTVTGVKEKAENRAKIKHVNPIKLSIFDLGEGTVKDRPPLEKLLGSVPGPRSLKRARNLDQIQD